MKLITSKQLSIKLSEMKERKYISYGKKRVSGSKQNSYIMHCRSICMPGKESLFRSNYKTKPKEINAAEMSQMTDDFRREKYINEKNIIGEKFNHDHKDLFTFARFDPHCDQSLSITIATAYKQVFGNLRPMSSECPVEIERRLRNGDIVVREFIRSLSKSQFYRKYFVEKVNQKMCVELSFMHLLGRPLLDNKELADNIKLINNKGFERLVDSLIDSFEYEEFFGENIVPFPRFWNSPCGGTTSSFIKTAELRKGYASSDNVI